MQNAVLVTNDGTCFFGQSFGAHTKIFGELCFTTAMTGYQESITDPSYIGQILVFAYPHIGNTGINEEDIESSGCSVEGIVTGAQVTSPSNYRSIDELGNYLKKSDRPGITGIDTRALVEKIRSRQCVSGCIVSFGSEEPDTDKIIQEVEEWRMTTYAEIYKNLRASEERTRHMLSLTNAKSDGPRVAFVDLGTKYNIMRLLQAAGFCLQVVTADTDPASLKDTKFDAVVLSNAPGDPREVLKFSQDLLKYLMSLNLPTLGICMGHQLIALMRKDLGLDVEKMDQGHRGINHPVLDKATKRVEITSQNHGYNVLLASGARDAFVSHVSLFDQSIAGLRFESERVMSVQFHPESSPGTHDSRRIFEEFMEWCV